VWWKVRRRFSPRSRRSLCPRTTRAPREGSEGFGGSLLRGGEQGGGRELGGWTAREACLVEADVLRPEAQEMPDEQHTTWGEITWPSPLLCGNASSVTPNQTGGLTGGGRELSADNI
jgi:hypothetical protein